MSDAIRGQVDIVMPADAEVVVIAGEWPQVDAATVASAHAVIGAWGLGPHGADAAGDRL